MSAQLVHCEVRLLTTAKEVGLRRLRGFAAALGGSGQICCTFAELRQELASTATPRRRRLVIYDQSLALTPDEFASLSHLARVFVIAPPLKDQPSCPPPQASSPYWQAEAYLQCSLTTFLESPVVRMSMTQLIDAVPRFPLDQLLRWGHLAQRWTPSTAQPVAAASLAFVRSLSLGADARRLSENFCDFLATKLAGLNLRHELVTFGSDGLLTLVTARCLPTGPVNTAQLTAALHACRLPITIVSRRDSREVELGALYYPSHYNMLNEERLLLVVGEPPPGTTELSDDNASANSDADFSSTTKVAS